MEKVFSVASWNVEHFKDGDQQRVERIVRFLQGEDHGPPAVPDVFALYEVEGSQVFWPFMEAFPEHHFHLTEGENSQEIFVGVHRRLQSFVTQRHEFQTGRTRLRPGLLLTLRTLQGDYSLLFLHIKSGPNPEDFGLRDAALGHAFNLEKALRKATGGPPNFIFMGDLNTMGVDDPVPHSRRVDLPAKTEIERLEEWARERTMKLEAKDEPATWWNGNMGPSDLDHVVAASHLDLRRPGGEAGTGATVLGWVKIPQEGDRRDWLVTHSDHGLVYFEVWTG